MQNNKRYAIICILLVIIAIIFPMIGLLLSIPLYFSSAKGKKKIFASILLGVLIGYLAYNFKPASSFDLVRWHNIVDYYANTHSISGFIAKSEGIDLEIIPKLISFVVSRFNDNNLLQFSVVTLGYTLLFYILADYREKSRIKMPGFLGVFVLILFGQSMLYYFSGLYNYVAINIFAFAFYLDYVKNNKLLSWPLYIIPALIHNSMLMPLALLIIYKSFGNRLNIKTISFALIVPFIFVGSVSFLSDKLGIFGLSSIQSILDMYMANNDHYRIIYSGIGLVIDILKLLLVVFICAIMRKRKEDEKMCGFALIMSITTILLMPLSIVMIRFATLSLFLSIVPLMDNASNKYRGWRQIGPAVYALAILSAIFNIYTIYPYGYKGFIINKVPTTMIEHFVEKR